MLNNLRCCCVCRCFSCLKNLENVLKPLNRWGIGRRQPIKTESKHWTQIKKVVFFFPSRKKKAKYDKKKKCLGESMWLRFIQNTVNTQAMHFWRKLRTKNSSPLEGHWCSLCERRSNTDAETNFKLNLCSISDFTIAMSGDQIITQHHEEE